jgi:hypothetical protein
MGFRHQGRGKRLPHPGTTGMFVLSKASLAYRELELTLVDVLLLISLKIMLQRSSMFLKTTPPMYLG